MYNIGAKNQHVFKFAEGLQRDVILIMLDQ